jgi:hypothetical protein
MRSQNRTQFNRIRLALLLLAVFCLLGLGISVTRMTQAGSPSSGTLSVANPLINYTGGPFAISNPSSPVGENPPVCSPATPCDEFALKVDLPGNNTTDYSVVVTINWTDSGTTTTGNSASDFDVYIYMPDGITKVAQGPGTSKPEIVSFQALPGDYKVVVVPYDVSPTVAFQGTIQLVSSTVVVQPTPKPLPQADGSTPRYQVFTPPPSILTRSTGNGTDAGEPSIGVNWKTGKVLFQSSLTTFRLTFDDSCPATPAATWEDKSAATAQTSLDPILFTDHGYNRVSPTVGRTITSQLSGTTSLSSYSDNDGDTWVPNQGGGIASGIDHQGIGAGPFHEIAPGVPFPRLPGQYPNAVYYCSQDIGDAACARSDDGGLTYGPAIPIYTLADCGGLHGHPKVALDGTVYVPNRGCGTEQAVVVSENNGMTWSIRNVPNSGNGGSDPAVGIGRGDKVTGGRIYLAYAENDSKAMVAVSDDHGKAGTWKNFFDVGAIAGVNTVAFPVAVAGDDDRAAVAFLGSSSKGDPTDRAFPGVWYLYIAHTYDGGQTWTTVNATPNDPVQRGGIWLGGGSPPHRNLLDFIGMDLDAQGRVVVGYADGCTGPACVQAPYTSTGNSYTALAAIARQTGGRRLFGPDTAATTVANVPGAPYVSVGRDGGVVHLTWSQSDDGGSVITGYKILRGTTSGGETLLATVGKVSKYDDNTADPNTTYYYKVVAANAQGESCGNNEVSIKAMGDSCNGLLAVKDPQGDQKSSPANADLDVLEIDMADRVEAGQNKLVFKLKVADLSLLVPNRQWRILWNYPIKAANIPASQFTGTYYVGMNSDGGVATFEYGTVTTIEAVPTNTSTPNKIGAADTGSSFDPQTGVITIVVAAGKVGNPNAGDIIGSLIARTFAGNGNETVKSQSAIDATSTSGTVDPYTAGSYMVLGNLNCQSSQPATPSISINDVSVTEGNSGTTSATFTVTLSSSSTSTVTVKYDTADGTATAPSDYQPASGTLTFVPGDTTETFSVAVKGDATFEADETFAVNLSNPTNATLADAQGTGTITNDDLPPATPPGISINNASVTEGDSGTTDAVFTVTLSNVSLSTVTVDFATVDGAARAGVDYQSRSGTLTFAPGESSKTISVPVIGETVFEGNETFDVNLSNPKNASITDNQGVGTIINDDTPARVQLSSTSYAVDEANTSEVATITVNRTGDTSQAITVDFATSDSSGTTPCQTNNNGIASDRCDYATAVGTLRFAAGESSKTIQIPLINDAYVEPDEVFKISIGNAKGAALGGNSIATVTIHSDDTQTATANPIDGQAFFIKQQYIDFLGRIAEPAGFQFWMDRMNNCPQGDTCDRIDTSMRFFKSDEFRERGLYVYLLYDAVLGRLPKYAEFVPDVARLNGFQTTAEQRAAKDAYLAEYINRNDFKVLYGQYLSSDGTTATDASGFVNALCATAGITPASKQTLITNLQNHTKDPAHTVEDFILTPEMNDVGTKFYDRSFITMQYFGYLRRDPEQGGFDFWVGQLMGANAPHKQDYRFMVGGFLQSDEYCFRFAFINKH